MKLRNFWKWWRPWSRLAAGVGSGLLLWSLPQPLCEIEGLGSFAVENFSQYGAEWLEWAGWVSLGAALLLPLRWAALASGTLVGGYAMLLMTFGQDMLELAAMSPEIEAAAELVTIEQGGVLAGVGSILLLLVHLIGGVFSTGGKLSGGNEAGST